MKHSSLLISFSLLSFFLLSCGTPTESSSEKKINHQTLTYRIIEYDNFSVHNPTVQVTFNNLTGDLVVDTVQVPWSKSFSYSYLNESDEFKTNLIVQYNDVEDVALKASIEAEDNTFHSKIGNSFLIEVTNTIKLSR